MAGIRVDTNSNSNLFNVVHCFEQKEMVPRMGFGNAKCKFNRKNSNLLVAEISANAEQSGRGEEALILKGKKSRTEEMKIG
ncbi:MAG: hypothetical protein RTU92_09935 [Candidatus Thorarchaeota archaeon]